MRSPWLSREYRKSSNVLVKKVEDGYILVNPKFNTQIKLTLEEYKKYENDEFNEIEYERLYLKGLAEDINGPSVELETTKINRKYAKMEGVTTFPLKVDNHKFNIILNPELGSWVAMTDEEFKRYEEDGLSTEEWETLFLRGLAKDLNGSVVEYDFPRPANYPSVVVVNITTGCNLRCKYCFADCGPFKGKDMTPEVMDKTIENMLSMPEVKIITFEFQGGEASTNVSGMRMFIEKVEAVKDKYDKLVKYRTEINCVSVTDELIDLIKEYNINVGISLDGPKEMNDQARVDINGHGSFDRIKKGIEKLRANGIYIDGAVCTIGQHNVHYPKEIMKFFDEIGISFKPRPVNILGREKENSLTTKPGEWAKCFEEMHKMSDEVDIENFSIHIFEENVYTPVRDYICLRYPCGAARELISVNPNGDVFPCDGFKGEEKFVMGNVLKERIVDMLKKPEVVKMRSRTAETIEKCSKCVFRAMCCSCCYSAFGKFGSIYREDPHCFDRRQMFIYLMQDWIRKNVLKEKSDEQSKAYSSKS
jgi:uncharacterized protein